MNITTIPEGTKLMMTTRYGKRPIIKLSNDYTGLNRDIAYFTYPEKRISKERFLYNMKEDIYTQDSFAIWQWELKYGLQLEVI